MCPAAAGVRAVVLLVHLPFQLERSKGPKGRGLAPLRRSASYICVALATRRLLLGGTCNSRLLPAGAALCVHLYSKHPLA